MLLSLALFASRGAWAAATDYTTQVQTIFTAKCLGCHNGIQNPNLSSQGQTPPASYALLVMVPGAASIIRAKPFDSANSYLAQKVDQTTGSMRFYLTAAESTTINNWINEGASTSYTVTPSAFTPVIGTSITISAQLKNLNSANVSLAGVTVNWSHSGGGSFASNTSTTNASGVATISFTVGTAANVAQTVSASTSFATGVTAAITPQPGPAAKYIVTQSTSNPGPGATLTVTAQLADASNNSISTAGNTITWGSTNGGSFIPATSQTNASGAATSSFTASSVIGTVHTVTATDGSNLTGTSTSITVNNHGAVDLVSAKPNGAVSVAPNGHISGPMGALSSDGRYMVFMSDASDLTSVPDTNAKNDVFVRDLQTGMTSLVSINAAGTATGDSGVELTNFSPVISANGRYVAFTSQSTDLISPAPTAFQHVYRRDLQSGQTILVSVNTSNAPGNNNSDAPVISDDGRFIAFTSDASNLAATDTNAKTDVFLRDCQMNTTLTVSINAAGTGTGGSDSSAPVISSDGRYVAFVSNSNDLVAGDSNGFADVFRRDMQTNGLSSTVLVSAKNGLAAVGDGAASSPSINATGQFVTFDSVATNLVAGDGNNQRDIFRRDCNTNTTLLITAMDGVQTAASGADDFGPAPMSADGRYVVFTSDKTNIVAGDTNGFKDVFRRDCNTNATVPVSAVNGGTALGNNGFSKNPEISADGRFVAFESSANNLTTAGNTGGFQCYRRDINTNSSTLLSISTTGTSGNADAQYLSMSADGTRTGFSSYSNNLITLNTAFALNVFSYSTNTSPTVSAGSAVTLVEGGTLQRNGTITDPDSLDTFTATVNYGDGGGAQALALAGSTFALSHLYADNGAFTVTVNVSDNHGGAGNTTFAVTVTNANPVAAIVAAPATGVTGAAINLTSTVTDAGTLDTFTYAWNVLKDGVQFSTGNINTFSLTPNGGGTYAVTLTVTDKDGGIGTANASIPVPNTAPTVAITGVPATPAVGTLISLNSTVTDPDSGDTIAYAWTVTKDGAPFSTGTNAIFGFTPSGAGTYAVSVIVTDKALATGSANASIVVPAQTVIPGNTNPTAAITGVPASPTTGVSISLNVTVVDPDANEVFSYAWSVSKDGTPLATGANAAFSFVPSVAGTYTVVVTVTDKKGGTGIDLKSIVVAGTATGGGGGGGSSGNPFMQALANTPIIFSVSPPAGVTLSYNFGDGSPPDTSNSNTVSHTYTTPGTFPVTVTATDSTGKTVILSMTTVVIAATNSGLDPDGDGFSNELELALSSLPTDPSSTPFNIPGPVTPLPLTVSKISLKFNFAKPGSDLLSIGGTLTVPAGFTLAGSNAAVDIGGAIQAFKLDAKGNGKSGVNKFKVTVSKKTGPSKFTSSLKGNFASALSDEGFTGSADLKSAPRTVIVNVIFAQTLFQTTKTVTFTAKKGKTGSAK